jgi:AraC family transcriptional regulator, regulatory protein of adaptative response / DNA-3-methyladenine glycosylase II
MSESGYFLISSVVLSRMQTDSRSNLQIVAGLDHNSCYQAFLSHDARFDGRLFACVKTTKIYCRPVCRVKPPMQKNCNFVAHAAQAEHLGYRPCLRCRPELSPGYSTSEASSRLAQAAASALQFPRRHAPNIEELAKKIGITSRHLRRLFLQEFGVTPIEYAQTQRLLLAKRLLTDTKLPVSIVSEAAGFGSVRRLNSLFLENYRLSPLKLRKEGALPKAQAKGRISNSLGVHKILLTYRPPYAWAAQLKYLSGRTLAGVEFVDLDKSVYWRSVRVKDPNLKAASKEYVGWISVSHIPDKSSLEIGLSDSLAPVIGQLMLLVRRLFDLDARPDDIAQVLLASKTFNFAPLLEQAPGLRLAGCFDGFELSIRAILGQLVSVKAAHATASKVVLNFGQPLSDFSGVELCPCDSIVRLTPEPESLLRATQEQLGALGVTRQKQTAIKAIAQALVDGDLVLDPTVDVASTIVQLKAMHGIGDWTAQYIAMRALAWPDAFPSSDYGVLKALGGTPAQAVKTSQEWRPWRAYATRYLWHSLSL